MVQACQSRRRTPDFCGSGVHTDGSTLAPSPGSCVTRTAARLARLYQARHQPFGVKTFRVLDMRTRDVQRGINAVTKARTRNATNRAVKKLDQSVVSLVVQFQAASGGYGATRCTPGAWTCCDPKRSKDLHESEQVACIWKCVQTPKTCTGFLGPHIQ